MTEVAGGALNPVRIGRCSTCWHSRFCKPVGSQQVAVLLISTLWFQLQADQHQLTWHLLTAIFSRLYHPHCCVRRSGQPGSHCCRAMDQSGASSSKAELHSCLYCMVAFNIAVSAGSASPGPIIAEPWTDTVIHRCTVWD